MSAQEAVDEKGQSKKGRDFASFFFNSLQLPIHGRWRTIGRIFAFIGKFLLGALAARPGTSKTGANSRSLNAASRWFHQDMTL
jgi:hypothetical protein